MDTSLDKIARKEFEYADKFSKSLKAISGDYVM
jgi:hypothetical protein